MTNDDAQDDGPATNREMEPTGGDEPGEASANDDGVGLKVQGPLRRNAPLIIGILVIMAVGPSVSTLLDEYRGIVLEVRAGEMLLGFTEKPPRMIDAIPARDGDIIAKERLSWSPTIAPRVAADHQLVALHTRFTRTYTGVVILISPPKTLNGPHTALVQLDDGDKINIPLYGEHLGTIQVGSRLQKESGMWEPILVPSGDVTNPTPRPPGVEPASAPTE